MDKEKTIGTIGYSNLASSLVHADAARKKAHQLLERRAERIVEGKQFVNPSFFIEKGQYGDFEWMIKSEDYKDALFIFNDNVEDHKSDVIGGGNAIIRPFNKYGLHSEYPRSAGIPTGQGSTGFKTLDEATKKHIDDAVDEIKALIQKHHYQRVYFSSDREGGLGTAIFTVGVEVRAYILQQILALEPPTIILSEDEKLLKLLENPPGPLKNRAHITAVPMELVNETNQFIYNYFSTEYDKFPGVFEGKRTFAKLSPSVGSVEKYCGVWFSFDLFSSWTYFAEKMGKMFGKVWAETFNPSFGFFKLKADIHNILVFTTSTTVNAERLDRVLSGNALPKPDQYDALMTKYQGGKHTETNYYLAAIICRIKEIDGWITWGDSFEIFVKNPEHFVTLATKYEVKKVAFISEGLVAQKGTTVNLVVSKSTAYDTLFSIESSPAGILDKVDSASGNIDYYAKIDPLDDLNNFTEADLVPWND